MKYSAEVFPAGVGFSYIVRGPQGYIHQPSKLWRTRAMAVNAAKRAVKRKESEQ